MFDVAYTNECNIEIARREIEEMNLTRDYQFFRISFAFSAGRYHSIMLLCHGGD